MTPEEEAAEQVELLVVAQRWIADNEFYKGKGLGSAEMLLIDIMHVFKAFNDTEKLQRLKEAQDNFYDEEDEDEDE